MKNLIPFTPQGLNSPVALVSPNCSQLVLDVINNSWDKSSSGLGDHHYVDSQSITDADELQEYWEEYSVQLDAEYQILTLSLPLNERGYLLNMSRLTNALDERFDDIDEVKDVANYGCAAGVSGFIYYNETLDFFSKHQEDIEDTLQVLIGDNYIEVLSRHHKDATNVITMSQLINKMVWVIVEDYCVSKSLIEAA